MAQTGRLFRLSFFVPLEANMVKKKKGVRHPERHMKVITAKVPPHERQQFKRLAEREGVTVSKLVRLLVLASLKHDGNNAPVRG